MASHSTSGPPTTSILPACSIASPFDWWCAILTIHTFVGLTGEKALSLLRYVLMFVESPLLVVDPLFFCFQIFFGFSISPHIGYFKHLQTFFWPTVDFPRPGLTPCICSTGSSRFSRIWWPSTPASPQWPLSPGTKRCNCCGSWKQRCKERWKMWKGTGTPGWHGWCWLSPDFFNWGYCRYPRNIPYYYWDIEYI